MTEFPAESRCSSESPYLDDHSAARFDRPPLRIVLFLPGRSLTIQLNHWARQRAGCAFSLSFARYCRELRRAMRRADAALLDATEMPIRAGNIFRRLIPRVGADLIAVYTENTASRLERLVRSAGSVFLLGPLTEAEWDGFFERLL